MKRQTKEDALRKMVSGIRSNLELENLKAIINEQIARNKDDPMNFMYHTKVDNYFYYVVYTDGSHHMGCIGQREYERYMEDADAVSIWRRNKSKILNGEKNCPMELLMQKA